MQKLWISFNEWFTRYQDTYQMNIGLLLAVLVILFIALGVCYYIMRKNNLYRKPKQSNVTLTVNPKNEVA